MRARPAAPSPALVLDHRLNDRRHRRVRHAASRQHNRICASTTLDGSPRIAAPTADISPARKSQAVQSVTCGCVWPLSCLGQPAGRQRRVAGRRGTDATRSPRVTSSAAMRGGTSGDRPPGLRREDPGRIAAELSRLAAGPHRWWSRSRPGPEPPVLGELALDRQAKALLYAERAVAPPFRPSIPGSRPESSPRPTRRTAAHGHTGERL